MKGYEHLNAADLHRERARLLRIVVIQRYMEMRRIVATNTERTVAVICAEADSAMYERILKLDTQLEEYATQKERAL